MQDNDADGHHHENAEGLDGNGEGNEDNERAKKESDDEIIIIILSIIFGITVLIVCVIGFVCHKRSKQQRAVTFNHDHHDLNHTTVNSEI